jgi:hypothetical protein
VTIDLAPPENLVRMVGSHDVAGYRAVGEESCEIFVRYGGIRPTDRVSGVVPNLRPGFGGSWAIFLSFRFANAGLTLAAALRVWHKQHSA